MFMINIYFNFFHLYMKAYYLWRTQTKDLTGISANEVMSLYSLQKFQKLVIFRSFSRAWVRSICTEIVFPGFLSPYTWIPVVARRELTILEVEQQSLRHTFKYPANISELWRKKKVDLYPSLLPLNIAEESSVVSKKIMDFPFIAVLNEKARNLSVMKRVSPDRSYGKNTYWNPSAKISSVQGSVDGTRTFKFKILK